MPDRAQAAADFGFVVDEDVAAYQGFVLGEHDTRRPVKAEVFFDPGDFFADAVAVVGDGRGADADVVSGGEQGAGGVQRALDRAQSGEETGGGVEVYQGVTVFGSGVVAHVEVFARLR